jgi:hypothetical protein
MSIDIGMFTSEYPYLAERRSETFYRGSEGMEVADYMLAYSSNGTEVKSTTVYRYEGGFKEYNVVNGDLEAVGQSFTVAINFDDPAIAGEGEISLGVEIDDVYVGDTQTPVDLEGLYSLVDAGYVSDTLYSSVNFNVSIAGVDAGDLMVDLSVNDTTRPLTGILLIPESLSLTGTKNVTFELSGLPYIDSVSIKTVTATKHLAAVSAATQSPMTVSTVYKGGAIDPEDGLKSDAVLQSRTYYRTVYDENDTSFFGEKGRKGQEVSIFTNNYEADPSSPSGFAIKSRTIYEYENNDGTENLSNNAYRAHVDDAMIKNTTLRYDKALKQMVLQSVTNFYTAFGKGHEYILNVENYYANGVDVRDVTEYYYGENNQGGAGGINPPAHADQKLIRTRTLWGRYLDILKSETFYHVQNRYKGEEIQFYTLQYSGGEYDPGYIGLLVRAQVPRFIVER